MFYIQVLTALAIVWAICIAIECKKRKREEEALMQRDAEEYARKMKGAAKKRQYGRNDRDPCVYRQDPGQRQSGQYHAKTRHSPVDDPVRNRHHNIGEV